MGFLRLSEGKTYMTVGYEVTPYEEAKRGALSTSAMTTSIPDPFRAAPTFLKVGTKTRQYPHHVAWNNIRAGRLKEGFESVTVIIPLMYILISGYYTNYEFNDVNHPHDAGVLLRGVFDWTDHSLRVQRQSKDVFQ